MAPLSLSFTHISALLLILVVYSLAQDDPPPINGEYTALGDSFAAGVGADGTYDSNNDCYQNNAAYPNLLHMAPDMGLDPYHFQACTGAASQQVDECQVPNNIPLDPSCHSSNPDGFGAPVFITLTVGGNNVEFADLLLECIYDLGEFANGGTMGCDARVAKTSADIDAVANDKPILTTINNALMLSGMDSFNFYVTGYPSYFSVDGDCPPFRIFVDPPTSEFRLELNGLVARLNQAISDQAAEAGVRYVDVEVAWNGHRWCEVDTNAVPWFNGLDSSFLDDTQTPIPNWVEGIFHPTPDGHYAYANRIREEAGFGPLIN